MVLCSRTVIFLTAELERKIMPYIKKEKALQRLDCPSPSPLWLKVVLGGAEAGPRCLGTPDLGVLAVRVVIKCAVSNLELTETLCGVLSCTQDQVINV